MIVFRTPTLLDIRAATTLGVNIKINDNPIGFFGTGLKYAIAILLREQCSISILIDGEPYHFTKRLVEIRGKEFFIICMNDKELGFTTEFGKDWPLWMAYRELYCNTMDESGDILTSRLENVSVSTLIVVEGLDKVHQNRHEFLFTGTPNFSSLEADIIFKPSSSIFYRGIAVQTSPKPFVYTYNLKTKIDLTENRTAKYSWEIENRLVDVLSILPENRLRPAVTTRDSFEHSINFPNYLSDPFWEIAGAIAKTSASDMNPYLLRNYQEFARLHRKDVIEEFVPTSMQRRAFDKALALVENLGFDVSSYDIRFAKRIGSGVLGAAVDGRIYITLACFDQGAKMIAGTLIEEFGHLSEDLEDETREMQNWLINRLVSVGEELKGEVL